VAPTCTCTKAGPTWRKQSPRPRESRPGRGGGRSRGSDQGRRLGLSSFQCRLRLLQKLCPRSHWVCLTANPGTAGAAYGFAAWAIQRRSGRIPPRSYADFNCLKLPDDAQGKENDYVMLSDIFPTGWHATELAGVKPGESVVIYGCGPVGLMAAHSAMIKGASKVIIVDLHPDRLALAEQIGAIAIDYSKGRPLSKSWTSRTGKAPTGLRMRRLPMPRSSRP